MTPEQAERVKAGVRLAEGFSGDMLLWRNRLGWTQEKMAAEIGISRVWYSKLERGLVPCERTTALAFAMVLAENLA